MNFRHFLLRRRSQAISRFRVMMSVLKQETEAENCGASIMNTRADITMTALATLCIAASLFFGSLMLIDSVEQGQQSLGQLPVNVHS